MTRDHAATVAQGYRIVEGAEQAGIPARLVGGSGVWHSLDLALRPEYENLRAVPRDVDLLLPAKSGRQIESVMSGLGFTPDERFNAMRGDQRQAWFLLDENGLAPLDIDVFIGRPPLCHPIDFGPRLADSGPAMDATDLLLQKIQIVEINQKDLVDAAFLLLDHGVGDDDPQAVAIPRVTELLAADWGFFHTATGNLVRIADAARDFLDPERAGLVADASGLLIEAAEAAPKPLRWRMRAKVGTKSQWYEDVEEVER